MQDRPKNSLLRSFGISFACWSAFCTILGAQIFALAISVVVGVAVLAWQGSTLIGWLQDLPRALHLDALVPAALSQQGGMASIVLPVLATVALLGGVVAYLATEKQ